MLAAWIGVAELKIDEEESKKLAEAINRVQALYNTSILSEETAAWINLTIVAAAIYGPRVIVIRQRKKKEKAASSKPVLVDLDGEGRLAAGSLN